MRSTMGALVAVALLAACGDDGDATLYTRLGGASGVVAVADAWIARAEADDELNGHFRNASLDRARLVDCMARYLGRLTGGPEVYPGEGCRDLRTAHAGRGVSRIEHELFASHLRDVLIARGVALADIDQLQGAMTPARAEIVEDEGDDATVYQRLGRKAGIGELVTAFEARVAADPQVNGFFASLTSTHRLHQCMTRLLCSLDGPCRYGEELPAEFAPLTMQPPCREMASSHLGLSDTGGNPIERSHFDVIAENLAAALLEGGVSPADVDTILGALAPTCPDIVADEAMCQ